MKAAASGGRPEEASPGIAGPAAMPAVSVKAAPEAASILSQHILHRISSLQQRNDSVRAELDRMPVAPGSVR